MKKYKLTLGITAFFHAVLIIGIMVILSIKKRSVPQALIALLGVSGISAALLLISHDADVKAYRKMKQLDAFYDYEADYYDEDYDDYCAKEHGLDMADDIDDKDENPEEGLKF